MSEILKKLRQRFHEKQVELHNRRKVFDANEAKLSALFADMDAIGCEPYTDGEWIHCSLSGDKHKFLQFARAIRKHGFDLPKIEKGETGFVKLETIRDGDSYLHLYFQFASTACRKVKVGTKMVEQDVFETVCDELMPYELAQPIRYAPSHSHSGSPGA